MKFMETQKYLGTWGMAVCKETGHMLFKGMGCISMQNRADKTYTDLQTHI